MLRAPAAGFRNPRRACARWSPAFRRESHRDADMEPMTLAEARRVALSLPDATEAPHHAMTSFRVRGRIFATAPADGAHLHVFVDDDERERAIASEPASCEKLWWGKKVVGVRIALERADRAFVARLLRSAWTRNAPKSLILPT